VLALDAADIHSGWTAVRTPCASGSAPSRPHCPSPLLKLDFDNGTEFLNAHFVSHFKAHEPRVELSLWNVSTRPVNDAGVFLQSTLLFVRQAHAVHVCERSTQSIEQHAVRRHHLTHHQFPVGGGCAYASQIFLIVDADLRQPCCASWS
jgi:hypothetical protein